MIDIALEPANAGVAPVTPWPLLLVCDLDTEFTRGSAMIVALLKHKGALMSTSNEAVPNALSPANALAYEVFVSEPPVRDNGFPPNDEPKGGSSVASTLIYGQRDAVLTDPGFTTARAQALAAWVAGKVSWVMSAAGGAGRADRRPTAPVIV